MRVETVKKVFFVVVVVVLVSVCMGISGNDASSSSTLLSELEMRSTSGQGCYGLSPQECGEKTSTNLYCSKSLSCPSQTLNTGASWNDLVSGNYDKWGSYGTIHCTETVTYTGCQYSNYSKCSNSCITTENKKDYCTACTGASFSYSDYHTNYFVTN